MSNQAIQTIESSSIEVGYEESELLLTLPSFENVTAVLQDVKTMMYNRSQEMVSSVNLTWIDQEMIWLQDELQAVFHRVESWMGPFLPDLKFARELMQPYLDNLKYIQKVIQQYLPEIQDDDTRDLVVIASASVVLSLFILYLFRNPRYHRKHRRPKRGRQMNHLAMIPIGSNHSRNNSNNHHDNTKRMTIHRPPPQRPTLHRGTDDSQMSSKDAGSFRNRLPSFDLSFRRRRLTSMDPYWGEDRALFVEQERDGTLESSLYEDEFDLSSMTYFGPTESKLRYLAWTPPPTWAEASRRVIPQDATRCNLQRQIILDVGKDANLKVVEGISVTATSSSMSLPISEWSAHVRTPVEGGVLELYVKNTPKEDWLELTFTSAHSCAQFQLDVLASQVFGNTLTALYQALEIVHQGSAAHPGKEFVLHDMKHGDDPVKTTAGGVAWDDAMRALNSLPSIRLSLERLLVSQRQAQLGRPRVNSEPSVTTITPKAADNSAAATTITTSTTVPGASVPPKAAGSLTEDYVEKRLLLGPVDFFRLFVPPLPPSAMPQNTNSESRVQHLLRWRKRLARAATLVQAYVRARTLVNQGWNLSKALPEPYLMRRLAYDDIEENQQRDFISKNEYYEAIVSRDVRCGARSVEKSKLLQNGTTTTITTIAQRHVLYQAYTLVGCHVFRLPKPDRWKKHSLRPNRDPIEALPSLRALISSHPEQDFMVNSFFCEGIRIAVVQVYARSLPKGVDPKFDAAMKKYTEGSKDIRDSMLQALVYLGQNSSQSFSSWIALRVLFYLLSWTRRCRLQALPRPTMSSDFFLSLPTVNVNHFAETFHFGGGAVNDTTEGNLPSNYVAMSAHVDSRHMPNLLARMVHSQIERGVLADSTVDFTLILESKQMDERPERALSTIRMVHFSPTEVALPVSYSNFNNDAILRGEPDVKRFSLPGGWIPNPWAFWSLAKMFVLAPLNELSSFFGSRPEKLEVSVRGSQIMSPADRSVYLSPCDTYITDDADDINTDEDVLEAAVTTIIQILAELKVPVRKVGLTEEELARSEPIPASFEWIQLPPGMHRKDFTSVNVLYRSTRSDVKRYLLASEGDVHTAAVRLAESITWRSFTFPVDIKSCRIELQSGQFFQQGKDRDGNPVFYFRNMCLGPWRKDEDAVISAVLHRLENSLKGFYPSVKCTVVVLMRRPYSDKRSKTEDADSSLGDKTGEEVETGTSESVDREHQAADDGDDNDNEIFTEPENQSIVKAEQKIMANPRLPEDERYYMHTNAQMIRKLVEILLYHYPERLSKVLIVPSIGNVAYFRSVVGGRLALASVVGSVRTRNKVRFLKKLSDLKIYVKMDELSVIVGGGNSIDPSVYEAR